MTEQPHLGARQQRFWRVVVFFLFLASGFAGLMYEVVWSRLLTYRFGATLDAITTILVAFMGGLALGAWLLGRMADRVRRPLALYGVLEIVIGLSAALLPFVLDFLTPLYRSVITAAPDALLVHRLWRFLLTGLMILVPTTAMGATLPTLSRFLTERRDQLGLNVGGLYALNTIGAVGGAFFTGFFLIIALGVYGTLYAAVLLNVAVGVASLLLSRRLGEGRLGVVRPTAAQPAGIQGEEPPLRLQRATLWLYGVSGLLALAYQVVWFRALVFNFEFLKNTTYSFSAMLTVFLSGIALGSALMTRLADRLRQPYFAFALLEVLIGIGGLFSFYAIYWNVGELVPIRVDPSGGVNWWLLVTLLFTKTSIAILIPTLGMGLLFPVAVRCYVGTLDHLAADVGRLYAFNTVGAILGAGVASFFLIPAVGIAWAIVILAALSIVLGLAMLWVSASSTPARRIVYTAAVAGTFLVVLALRFPHEFPVRMQYIAFYEEQIYYADGPLATVSVVENSKGERTVYVDNVGVAGTDPMLLTDQKSLAHIPMLFLPEPKRVLTVGFGSGGASYSYSTYPMLEAVHCVEIDPTVPRAAHTLTASNHGLLMPRYRLPGGDPEGTLLVPPDVRRIMTDFDRRYETEPVRGVTSFLTAWRDFTMPPDFEGEVMSYHTFEPRFRLILDDVRSYLQYTDERYDVIATDCTDLRYKTNANLYDLEYFQICRDRITDDGLVVVWMPLAGLTREMYDVALRTFAEVFPDMAIWYMNNEPTHYCLLVGWKNELEIDLDRMMERLQIPEVRRDLHELNLDDPAKILSCYLTDTRDFKLGAGQLNTENNPILEFMSPKYGYGDAPLLQNLAAMAEARNDVMHYVTGSPALKEEIGAKLAAYEAAEPHILAGHEHFRRIELREACREYMKAHELAPDDRAVRRLLDFPELKLIADRRGDLWAKLQLGQLYQMQERDGDALKYIEQVIAAGQPLPPPAEAPAEVLESFAEAQERFVDAVNAAAEIYRRNGQEERARQLLEAI